MTRQLPARGIFFAAAELPGKVIGLGDPLDPLSEQIHGKSVIAARLARLPLPAATRHVEVPEISATGEVRRCVIALDFAKLATASDFTLQAVIRHEIGHCLGFFGHVSSGLMKPVCCALNITSDVTAMMRKLYSLPPGTDVIR